MDRDLLARCGIALYGREWVSPLAAALGINLRTMQRWAADETAPNPDTWANIKAELKPKLEERRRALAEDRAAIAQLIKEL